MRAKLLAPTAENLRVAAEALRRGELVAMPTETVYGLAGAAFDGAALASIFETKARPTFDPLIVHAPPEWGSIERLEAEGLIAPGRLSAHALASVRKLMRGGWPGPLTLVLPKGKRVPDLATSGLTTVAVRVPAHPVAIALLREAGIPLAAPSANRFGRISPTSSADVAAELGGRIDWIIDGGPCEIGIESSVVSVDASGALALLRPGGLSVVEIERLSEISLTTPRRRRNEPPHTPAESPGMLLSHYAPVKTLVLLAGPLARAEASEWARIERLVRARAVKRLGVLAVSTDPATIARNWEKRLGIPIVARRLTVSGDSEVGAKEAAQNLFARLRELDASEAELLCAEPFPTEEGLGYGISDRLRRAASDWPE